MGFPVLFIPKLIRVSQKDDEQKTSGSLAGWSGLFDETRKVHFYFCVFGWVTTTNHYYLPQRKKDRQNQRFAHNSGS